MSKLIVSFLLIVLIFCSSTACSTVSYTRWNADGSVIEFDAWETGTDKALDGLDYEGADFKLHVDSVDRNQTRGMEEVNKFIEHAVQGAVQGMKP